MAITNSKKTVISVISALVLACVVSVTLLSCGKKSNTMTCTFTEHHGILCGADEKPICVSSMYSSSEPFNIEFESTVDFYGTKVTKIYCRGNMVFTEYPYTSEMPYLTPIAKYDVVKDKGQWIFTFDEFNESDIPLERKLRQATTVDEVKNLLNGTTWHCLQNNYSSPMSWWTQVKFDGDNFICYTASPSDGKWTEAGRGQYEIGNGQFANTGDPYIYLTWTADGGEVLAKLPCEYVFIPTNCQFEITCKALDTASRGITGNWYGPSTKETGTMILGEYKW